MKILPWTLAVVAVALTFSATNASAVLIASDSFVTTATGAGNTYTAGNLSGQTATTGTSGYSTGLGAGWNNGNTAFSASTTPLTHPFLVNPSTLR